MAVDQGDVMLLTFLGLSEAIYTVHHAILIDRLQKTFCLGGPVLKWVRSFITDQMQAVSFAVEQI